MSERVDFIKACLNRREQIVEICHRFGISEKTGQKWLKRFREGDLEALKDRSHAPLNHAGRITPEVITRILALKRKYPLFGPEKLRDWLLLNESPAPGKRWPAASSIGELLRKHHLVRKRRQKHLLSERSELAGRTMATAPNVVWTADFKGQFKLSNIDRAYCYPLTVLDLHTHFLLGCTALESTDVAGTQKSFTRLFREFGLPEVIRTDNGVPFAQPTSLGRLGQLALWWVRLGIKPEYIRPGRPSENGAHERFHKTLKEGATKPSCSSLAAQQQRFDSFRSEYNTERPHRNLPQRRPPAQHYVHSPRPYPKRLPELVYPDDWAVRKVRPNGCIAIQQHDVYLSMNLAGQDIGVTDLDDDNLIICYGQLELGTFEMTSKAFTARVKWSGIGETTRA
jgi:transposase InsO family protein